MALIEARGLAKAYDGKPAVRDLSFKVRPGSVTGFLGPNGAGKSTTMRLMLELDNGAGSDDVRRAAVHGAAAADAARRGAAGGEAVPPDPQGPQPPADAGRGQRDPDQPGRRGARAGRASPRSRARSRRRSRSAWASDSASRRALLGDPHTLILDEPANGLDPQGIQWMRQFLKALAGEGRSVFVSSHLLSEMALLADELVVIGRGRMISSGPVSSFIDGASHKSVLVHTPQADELRALLAGREGVTAEAGPEGEVVVTGLDARRDRRPGVRPPDPAARAGASDGDARGGVPRRDRGRRGVPGGGHPRPARPTGWGTP